MVGSGLASSLNMFTLIAVLLIAVAFFVYFLRKRKNRHPMDTPEGKAIQEKRAKEAEERRREEGRPEIPTDEKRIED